MDVPRLTRREVLARLAVGSGAALLGLYGCKRPELTGGAFPDDLAELDLRSASRAVRSRQLSPINLTRACLARIERLNPRLNAYITVTSESALTEARQAEEEIKDGRWRGPLHGIPIALKDNVDTAGVRTTAASAVFGDRVPSADAEVVQRLRAAGAVFLGKQNLHEFALGTTSAISNAGPVRNPWDLERVAGGSSGGSAAAVAAGLCFGAVATDTGGSIRIPAACCGVVGLKPSFGVVSAAGTVPVSHSFDHVGPICRTVGDAALMFRAMTEHEVPQLYDPDAPSSVANLRVGAVQIVGEMCDAPVEAAIQTAVSAAIEVIRNLVADVRDVELPMPDLGGLIAAECLGYHQAYLVDRPERYDARTRATIQSEKVFSEDETMRLRETLQLHRAAAHEVFSRVDLVVLPTLPRLPMLIRDAGEPFALDACTFAFSVGGWPAISIPCGFSPTGLPIGLLVGGPALSEPNILALAQAYESATNWHLQKPAL
jgi:aspartyl-tRNA(Asn)/glutamyl-tRNA(Gln) amidotransferase subunit A